MEILEPVQRARNEKTLHLAAAKIVDERVPVLMESLARIGMLVQRGAVEACKAVRVGREVCRHPIENDADASGVQRIDKARKAFRCAVVCRRHEQAERLIAPRPAKRMLGNRKQLHVREAHVGEIRDQPVDRDVPKRRRAGIVRGAHPRCQMQLIK